MTDSKRVQGRINVLESLIQEVRKDGTFSDESKKQLQDWFGAESVFVLYLCLYNGSARKEKENAKKTGKWENLNVYKEILLKPIRHAREVLEEVKRQVQAKEEFERGTKIATLNLPSDKASERMIRYETTIERRMHRALEQLGRLPRERKGEPSLPSINVNLNQS